MLQHIQLGDNDFAKKRKVHSLVASGKIKLGGHKKGKVYGILSCNSGKRMTTENRVFFCNEQEALKAGYRPCGNCMPEKYKIWKVRQGKSAIKIQ